VNGFRFQYYIGCYTCCLVNSEIIFVYTVFYSKVREGNCRSSVALATRQSLMVLQLRAQGLEEGDEHPVHSLVEHS